MERDPEGMVKWTAEDESELKSMETEVIRVEDTELGRQRKRKAAEMNQNVDFLEIEELDKLSQALAKAYQKKNINIPTREIMPEESKEGDNMAEESKEDDNMAEESKEEHS